MDPKDKKEELLEPEKISQEPQFDFEEAKDLTVGQVIRKNEEIEAGVTPDDTILDKYIKQHREEIEADKFTNIQAKKEELRSLDDLLQDAKETIDEEVEPVEEVPDLEIAAEEEGVAMEEFLLPPLEETLVMDKNLVEPVTEPLVADDDEALQEEHQSLSRSAQAEDEPQNKKLWVILSALLAIVVLIIGGSYYVYRQITRSSQEIQSQSSDAGLVSNQAILNQFNSLYDTFYTDENKTALKNSQFSQLSQLKELLDKLEGASEHTLAKSKYDSLETQIKAVQDVNAQFETPAITDGVLNTNAKVKADAKFTEVKTGNTEIDKLLDKAISLGKSQLSSSTSSSSSQSSSSNQTESNSATESNASSSANASTSAGETASANNILNSGLASNGVNLQRSVSRVPYNQSAINDSSNPAWEFTDGVLEQILATSRARGYITGNQYILEPVNIVNGNGYYNLYKPDGTYLFTLNCKTGYFVGNGSGHADDLDY
ncbi:cell division site-positioning protein MapZ [Streptococcus taonis]|uniref:Mid-cell-anchored protein Z n=1 Tax=Streptococcus taonis TaxID=3041623 RepID=A0ABT6PD24_9STRE|nr:cell division site-positioning protein MapZ family protein [Streptococcus sp. ST22-14]MDI1473889.1 cell division site-positioning protein MapZ family protein [Streptococcus sp. ST22-14]